MTTLLEYLINILAVIAGDLTVFYVITVPAESLILSLIIVFFPLLIFVAIINVLQKKSLWWCLLMSLVAILTHFFADILIFNFTNSLRLIAMYGAVTFVFLFPLIYIISNIMQGVVAMIKKSK